MTACAPGLERRIAHRFDFPDYTPLEMARIVDAAIIARGFRCSCSMEQVGAVIEAASTSAQRAMINAGVADLLVPAAVQCLNQRLDEASEGAQLVTIELGDLEQAAGALHWPSVVEQ